MFEEIVNKISLEYPKRVLSDLLPNQMVRHYSASNECLNDIELASENKFYKGSDYFIDPNQKEYIHFTSFDKVKEIITTNKLRLYDLNYADDPHEITFTIKNTGIDFGIDSSQLKSLLFSMSFCSYPVSENDEHNMWRLYGSDGRGVGLVCSFINNCEFWNDFHLGKIYYKQSEKITAAFKKHKDFFDELTSKESYKHSITDRHLLLNLLQLFAFHKHSIYGSENEFRLLHHFNLFSQTRKETKRIFTVNRRNNLSSYIELNLCQFSKSNFSMDNSKEYLPLIKIDKLILGYRYSEAEKQEIEQVVRDIYVHNQYNHSTVTPKIEITPLKEIYFT